MLPSLAAVAPHAHSAICWVPSNQRLERSVTDLVAGRLARHTSEDRAERLRLPYAAAQARTLERRRGLGGFFGSAATGSRRGTLLVQAAEARDFLDAHRRCVWGRDLSCQLGTLRNVLLRAFLHRHRHGRSSFDSFSRCTRLLSVPMERPCKDRGGVWLCEFRC